MILCKLFLNKFGFIAVRPVFLDCWIRSERNFARSSLFVVVRLYSSSSSNIFVNMTNGFGKVDRVTRKKKYITPVFDIRDPATGTPLNVDYSALLSAGGIFTDASFYLIENQSQWQQGLPPEGSVVKDIKPLKGTLVLFDSVALPHEVLPVLKGKRIAIAGN